MAREKVQIYTTIEAETTSTIGKYKYLVALKIEGQLGEEPDYTNYQIIYADSEEHARMKYNALNFCQYSYGEVIQQLDNNYNILNTVESLTIASNDIIVAKVNPNFSAEALQIAADNLRTMFPDNSVIIIPDDTTLSSIDKSEITDLLSAMIKSIKEDKSC